MKRFFLLAAAGVLVFAAGATGVVAWLTRDGSGAAAPAAAAAAPVPVTPLVEVPAEPEGRERALETNVERQLWDALRRGFVAADRSPAAEARIVPALEAAFPRAPAWRVECRGLVCRVEVDAPPGEWRDALLAQQEVRRHADRHAFDPAGGGVVLLELLEAAPSEEAPPRPEGEKVLDALEELLLASQAARDCLSEGPAPRVEVRLMVDRSGVTYRFGAGVDSKVASCLMLQAMPDVLATASAPAGVRRAERRVVIPAAP